MQGSLLLLKIIHALFEHLSFNRIITGIFSESTFVDHPGPGDLLGRDEAGIHSTIDTCARVLYTHGKSLCYALLQKGNQS